MIVLHAFRNLLKGLAGRTDLVECPIDTLQYNQTCTASEYIAISPTQYGPYGPYGETVPTKSKSKNKNNASRILKVTGSTVLSPQQYIQNGTTYSPATTYGPLTCECTSGVPAKNPQNLNTGMCYIMQCRSDFTGQLYVETAGGTGADFLYYDDTGTEVYYYGGNPGIVFGTIDVTQNDIIEVQFGYDASQPIVSGTGAGTMPETPGNGGFGAFLGGCNGGGSTTVSVNSNIKLIAPGGGGAGRNASGGNAGSAAVSSDTNTNIGLTYNETHPNPIQGGNPGCTLFGNSQTPVGTYPVSYSGGGGSYKHAIAADGSWSPMYAGGNASDSLCGGGGGGSGYYGGAQGTWNQIAKPNNLHGSGGGGSVFIDQSTVGASTQNGLCQFGSKGNPVGSVVAPSNYIVFGYPKIT